MKQKIMTNMSTMSTFANILGLFGYSLANSFFVVGSHGVVKVVKTEKKVVKVVSSHGFFIGLFLGGFFEWLILSVRIFC